MYSVQLVRCGSEYDSLIDYKSNGHVGTLLKVDKTYDGGIICEDVSGRRTKIKCTMISRGIRSFYGSVNIGSHGVVMDVKPCTPADCKGYDIDALGVTVSVSGTTVSVENKSIAGERRFAVFDLMHFTDIARAWWGTYLLGGVRHVIVNWSEPHHGLIGVFTSVDLSLLEDGFSMEDPSRDIHPYKTMREVMFGKEKLYYV